MAMEKLQMFCIYDCKMELYLSPFTAINAAVAAREFETAVMTPNHNFNQHPDDYSLWEIGEFDQQSAAVGSAVLRNVVQAHHIMARNLNQLHEENISG